MSYSRQLYFIASLVLLVLGSKELMAQNTLGNTPFSRQPLGDFLPDGFTRNQAMGGVAVANPSVDYINQENPANLYYNHHTNFEFVLQSTFRRVSNRTTQTNSAGVFPINLGMSFPLGKKATAMVGIKPRSFVDYNLNYSEAVPNTTDTVNYGLQGSGGLSKAYVGIGFALAEGLTFGLEAGYNFGNIEFDRLLRFGGVRDEPISRINNTVRYRQVSFRPGIAYRLALDSTKKKYLNFGATYELSTPMQARQRITYGLLNFNNDPFFLDTLNADINSNLSSPSTLTAGVSYYKSLHYTVGAEVAFTQWQSFSNLDGTNANLPNTVRVSLGTEWIPNYSGKYLSTISYRAGLQYQTIPLVLSGSQVEDIRLSLGLGFPVVRKEARFTRPYINLNMFVGQRGNVSTTNLQELYIGGAISLTLNDFQWFKRYKID